MKQKIQAFSLAGLSLTLSICLVMVQFGDTLGLDEYTFAKLQANIGIYLLLFSLLAGTTIFQSRTLMHLGLPASLLALALTYTLIGALICIDCFYEDSGEHWMYSLSLGTIFALLLDNLINSGRITYRITDRILRGMLSCLTGI